MLKLQNTDGKYQGRSNYMGDILYELEESTK